MAFYFQEIQLVFVVSLLLLVGNCFQLHRQKRQSYGDGVQIRTLFVESYIRHRFASTKVNIGMMNQLPDAREATFTIQLPNEAFISNFSMVVNEVERLGEVKEREIARHTYNRERERGRSAGHVETIERDMNIFSLQVNIEANATAFFYLTYQELLRRTLGFYEHKININPKQVVDNLHVSVEIEETRPLKNVLVPKLKYSSQNTVDADSFEENELAYPEIDEEHPHLAFVEFNPTIEEQIALSSRGVAGQLIVKYDVERDNSQGDIQMVDGYFVHFFAPEDFPPLAKSVVFVLDVSGSMYGRKIEQLRASMTSILGELRENDYFNVITFNTYVRMWKSSELFPATAENVAEARSFINSIQASGSTNIHRALEEGMNLMESQRAANNRVPFLVFLTDGEPTVGVTSKPTIISRIEQVNGESIALFSLGFGREVDFNFLKRLSLKNRAFAKKIYEDSDAAIQLENFFKNVASPMMKDIKIDYSYLNDGSETELVEKKFSNFFSGTELVAAGKLEDIEHNSVELENLKIKVSGSISEGDYINEDITTEPIYDAPQEGKAGLTGNFLEKMWAYLTIKELLKEIEKIEDSDDKRRLRQQAVDLALKYNFVTPVTSMVVTQGNEPQSLTGGEGIEGLEPDVAASTGPLSSAVHSARRPPNTAGRSGRLGPMGPSGLPGSIYPSGISGPMGAIDRQRNSGFYHYSLNREQGVWTARKQGRIPTTTTRPTVRRGQYTPSGQEPQLQVRLEGIPVCVDLPLGAPSRLTLLHDRHSSFKLDVRLGNLRHAAPGSKSIYMAIVEHKRIAYSFRRSRNPTRPRKHPIYSRPDRTLNVVTSAEATRFTLDNGLTVTLYAPGRNGNRRRFVGFFLDIEWRSNVQSDVCRRNAITGFVGKLLCQTATLNPQLSPPVPGELGGVLDTAELSSRTPAGTTHRAHVFLKRRWPKSSITSGTCWYATALALGF